MCELKQRGCIRTYVDLTSIHANNLKFAGVAFCRFKV